MRVSMPWARSNPAPGRRCWAGLAIAAGIVCSPAGADTYTLRAGQEVFRIHLPQGYGEVGAGTYDARDDQVAIEVMAYAPIAAGVEDATDRLIDGFRLGCRNTRPGHPGEFASSKEVSDTGITARCVCRMGDGSVSLLKALVWTHDGRSYAKSVRVESFPMPGKTPALAPLLERASAILDEVSYSSH